MIRRIYNQQDLERACREAMSGDVIQVFPGTYVMPRVVDLPEDVIDRNNGNGEET